VPPRFRIRRSPDQRPFAGFPGLIAGCRVLRRLSMPRHPPYTLLELGHSDRPPPRARPGRGTRCRRMIHATPLAPCGTRGGRVNHRRIRAGRRPHDSPKRCPTTPPTAGSPNRGCPTRRKDLYADGAGGTHAVFNRIFKRGGVADSLATLSRTLRAPSRAIRHAG
jgi:hypothetical protein